MLLDRANAQHNLGNWYRSESERASGTQQLAQAVNLFREALKERTRERVPLDWAATQNDLGITLTELGRREGSIARLEEAIAALREALKEWTRERVPLDWACGSEQPGLGPVGIGTASERPGTAGGGDRCNS